MYEDTGMKAGEMCMVIYLFWLKSVNGEYCTSNQLNIP
jgi:hypothetical protein